MTGSFTYRYAEYVVTHPWRLLLLSLIVIFAAASGGRFLEFTNDYREFFSDDNPELLAFEATQNTYNKADNVMFVLEPADGEVFTNDTLAIVDEITEQAWQIPFSSRVDSITNYQHTIAEEDDLIVGNLVVEPENLSQAELDTIRTVALNEPLLVHRLVSTSGHITAINVTVQLPGIALDEVGKVVADARILRDKILAEHPEIKIYLSGLSMMDNSFGEASKNDMTTLIPLMFLVVIVILGLLLRSVTATFSTVIVIFSAILFGMGCMGWLGWKLTPPSASAPTIILTMSVADAVHLLVTFLHNLRHGQDKKSAMTDSLRVNLQPIFITSITTAIGFLSMNFSDVPPFHDLGNVVAMGVMFAFVLAVTTLPALMMVLPVRVSRKTAKKQLHHPMDKLANFVIQYRRILLWGMGSLAVVLISFFPLNTLDDQFVEYFDQTVEFRRDTDFVVANLNGIYDIHYSLQQGESGGISEPEFLAKVDQFANWMRHQDKVIHVNSITDTFKRLNKNMHGDDPAYYRLPESRELAAQYLLLYEMSLPYGLDLNDQIDIDKSSTRVTVTFENLHTEQVIAIEQKLSDWLRQNAPEIEFTAASATIMFANIGERNVRSMLFGTTIALVIISFILMVALRSFRIGLISLAPNLLPAGMAFGIWGLMVGQVGLSLSVVVGMTLGIVVDDTVHFLSKYLRARREKGLDSIEAVRYAFNTVGVALWVTSLVLVAGFIVLGSSHFALNAHMGMMTAITIAIALMMDFLFLPPLLMKLEGKKMRNWIIALVLTVGLLPVVQAETAEEKGLAIITEADNRDKGWQDSSADMVMILRNKQGKESVREIRVKNLEVDGDGDKGLTVFDQPRDVKGTAFLTYSHALDPDEQWIFLPALKRVKRISSSNKSGPFMGSEFAYEDISSFEIPKYSYLYLRDETLDGLDTFVLEIRPQYKYSGYTKSQLWIDKQDYQVRKIDFYDRKDTLLKTQRFLDYKKYLDQYWRADTMTMENHQNGKSTTLKSSNYTFRNGLTDKDFEKNDLKRQR